MPIPAFFDNIPHAACGGLGLEGYIGRMDGRHSAKHWLVLGLALLGMAVSGPAIRFVQAAPLAIVVWRVVFCWPVLAGVALARRERWPLLRGSAAGLFLALHWVLWVASVQHTTLATATLLVSTGALWAAVLSRPLLGETVTRRQWLGLALALGGLTLVVLAPSGDPATAGVPHTLLGDLLALGGAFAWVGYAFVGRRARQQASFFSYTSAVYGATGLVVLAAALLWQQPLSGYDGRSWLALAVLAALPTLLGHGGLNYLLRFIGPARLALWTLSEPVFATVLAAWLFGEIPVPQVMMGGVAILAGIALGVSPEGHRKPAA